MPKIFVEHVILQRFLLTAYNVKLMMMINAKNVIPPHFYIKKIVFQ